MIYTIYNNPFIIMETGNAITGKNPVALNYVATEDEIKYGIDWDIETESIIIDSNRKNTDITNKKNQLKYDVNFRLDNKKNSYVGVVSYDSLSWKSGKDYVYMVERILGGISAGIPANQITYRDSTGSQYVLTQTDYIELKKLIDVDLLVKGNSLYMDADIKISEIDIMTTLSALDAYDINAGWSF